MVRKGQSVELFTARLGGIGLVAERVLLVIYLIGSFSHNPWFDQY